MGRINDTDCKYLMPIYKNIVKWHIETFPNTTKFSQVLKVLEELVEWVVSGFSLMEAADVYIAATSLQYRYRSRFGRWVCAKFESPLLVEVARGKMRINKNRLWYGNHHKGV